MPSVFKLLENWNPEESSIEQGVNLNICLRKVIQLYQTSFKSMWFECLLQSGEYIPALLSSHFLKMKGVIISVLKYFLVSNFKLIFCYNSLPFLSLSFFCGTRKYILKNIWDPNTLTFIVWTKPPTKCSFVFHRKKSYRFETLSLFCSPALWKLISATGKNLTIFLAFFSELQDINSQFGFVFLSILTFFSEL